MRLSPFELPEGMMVTRPPPVSPLTPCRASPHAVPRLQQPLIKMSFLIIIGCPAHFGKQLQRCALAVVAAAAKYRHVTLVFSPVRWSLVGHESRESGAAAESPQWTLDHCSQTHSERNADGRQPIPGSISHKKKNNTHKKYKHTH